MSEQIREGGCQCGDVRYKVQGQPHLVALCHCSMCRRAHSAPVVTWAIFEESDVSFTGVQPKQFSSSPEANRGFCAECGSQVSFTSTFMPGLVDICVGSLDDPESVEPTVHMWFSKHLSWINFGDKLPRYPELPPMASGTESTVEEG